MLMKQVDHNGAGDNIRFGDSFTEDQFASETFDYLLANPPFGVDWKKQQKEIQQEHDKRGFDGRFGAGLPRVNDGSLLFLQHMIAKFEPVLARREQKHGSRLAIVFSGSPLFTGGAGSGESDIRKWIIENDWLEAIVALPEQMFYNTGIGTYIWIVTNRKGKKRKRKIQLIDCRERFRPMPRSLGDKRRYLDQEIIDALSHEHGDFKQAETSKIFENIHFGFRRITVERPLRLRFQIASEAREMFLNACPELFDAVEAVEEEMGTDPHLDWNTTWTEIQRIVKDCEIGWASGSDGTKQKNFFRDCFTATDSKAERVIAKRGSFTGFVSEGKFPGQQLIGDLEPNEMDQIFGIFPETNGKKGKAVEYEADPKLRDYENVPLNEDIVSFFLREVRPFVADAWINGDGKRMKKESMVFPRYHQLHAVRELVTAAAKEGPGHNYLVEHSAGSGKSNTIGWLAHRLSNLHDAADERVFDSVIVVTDRIVLDQQLQDTIYQFDHRQGVVQKIEENSRQLAEALENAVPIIITTLQKFPFVTQQLLKMAEERGEDRSHLPTRQCAVIIDEAHSSQSGETATDLKEVLGGEALRKKAKELAEEEGGLDLEELYRSMAKRGQQPNLSFFAFTATPKHKTIKVFGQSPICQRLKYTMRQAIEEGFILDVLKNYDTYETYYKLLKACEDDPNVERKKAARAWRRFMRLHPHNLAQKTAVMVEHFQAFSRHKIGGQAKAMVVTGSRLEAVRYKQGFDEYINKKGYKIKSLVAFSGIVIDDKISEKTYTEPR